MALEELAALCRNQGDGEDGIPTNLNTAEVRNRGDRGPGILPAKYALSAWR